MRPSSLVIVIHLSVGSAALVWAAPQETIPRETAETSQRPEASAMPVSKTAPVPVGSPKTVPSYVLGPDDLIAIKVLDADEVNGASIRVDPSGNISLPLVGRLKAGGLTVEQLEKDLSSRLKTYVRDPVVAISVVEYRSQPVSVLGAVESARRAPARRT